MATDPQYRLLTADEFLAIEFGPDMKAELDDGVIRMMAGGTAAHARVQGNIFSYLRVVLRGSGCRPFGADMAVRSGENSIRYPDVSIYCGRQADPPYDQAKAFDDPLVLIEVLSANTTRADQGVKLDEYKAIASVATIAFVDPETEQLRVLQRTGPDGWLDDRFVAPADIAIPALGITIPHSEMFARD